MADIDNSNKPAEPTGEDYANGFRNEAYEVGSHLIKAAGNLIGVHSKLVEAENKVIVDAANSAGQFIADHPVETAVVASTGVVGLGAMKAAQAIYAENEKDLAPIVDSASKTAQALYTEASTVAMDSSKRLAENIKEKPVTTAAEFILCPVLPALHAVIGSSAQK